MEVARVSFRGSAFHSPNHCNKMSDSSHHLLQIETLISSGTKSNKSLGYSTLLHFQESSGEDPSSLQSLAACSQSLFNSLLTDILNGDEEIAMQALKCLGFMIYHPSIVATISADDTRLVLQSLVELIMTTKSKCACNLGVWCISMQQLSRPVLANHFDLMLQAVIYALDNPIGSLSTTFEAIQAVVKLEDQLDERMRLSSHIWAPSIYRRLLSMDKKERDISDRCLLKTRCTILPPTSDLSKVLVKDMKLKLLIGMKNLLNQGMKVQAIHAWGWFVRLLGSYALMYRNIVNDMLKIPECTFTDYDPQVQIATLVAWEGLIDALINSLALAPQENAAKENVDHKQQIFGEHGCEVQANGLSKSIKLIMTPLTGIICSKCDVSVHSTCFKTWCYLLHKLNASVNKLVVIKLVLEPILEAVFQNSPDSKSIWIWNECVDLLSDFISEKCRCTDLNSISWSGSLATRICISGPSVSEICSWKQYHIKWFPWELRQLDFLLKMIFFLMCAASEATIPHELRSISCDSALGLFESVLKGVQLELRSSSIKYNDIMICLNTLLQFMKKLCEGLHAECSCSYGIYLTCFQFAEAVVKDLGPSVLGSPLYKFALDLSYFGDMKSVDDYKYAKLFGVCHVAYMDMVSPTVYLLVLCFKLMVQLVSYTSQLECTLCRIRECFKYVFSSHDTQNLHTAISLLYKHIEPVYLNVWIAMGQGLTDCIDDVDHAALFKTEDGATDYSCMYHFLSYPLVVCSTLSKLTCMRVRGPREDCQIPPQRYPGFKCVTRTWKSLFLSLTASCSKISSASNFSENLCSKLIRCLDDYTDMLDKGTDINLTCKDLEFDLISLSGCLMMYILEITKTSAGRNSSKGRCEYNIPSSIRNLLKFVARYVNLLWEKTTTNPESGHAEASRVFSVLAHFVSCLHLKQDILLFTEMVSCLLLPWLSHTERQDKSTNDQLQHLWNEYLNCLRRSHPPINFDSAFLKHLEPLLVKALDHQYTSISEPTIIFWNATFGEQIKLDYPQTLLHVLDKLCRYGKLKLQRRSHPFIERYDFLEVSNAPQRYKVKETLNRRSKRVKLVLDTKHFEQKEGHPSSSKRKRLELTEHQKEVRRAQQGKERDSDGHGPGIRTYASVDFSQGLEDSKESQKIRDSECILEKLRRLG